MTVEMAGEKYLSVGAVAAIIGVSRMTVHRWALKGATPEGTRLKVIRDSINGYLYIAEDSITTLSERYNPQRRFLLLNSSLALAESNSN